MEKGATVKLVYDPRTKKAKVRVTYNRQPRLFSTLCDITLTKAEFDNVKLKITKSVYAECDGAVKIARQICEKMGNDFSFSKFKKLYHEQLYGSGQISSVLDRFETIAKNYISNLITAGSRSIYQTSVNWVLRYDKNIRISDIDQDTVASIISFIKENSKMYTGKELGENSIRIYLRSLRAIAGSAVRDGIVKVNPFAHIKGQSLSSITREKGALSDAELSKFLQYNPCNQKEKFAQDMFLLSLLMCGANLGDICALTNSNIIGDEIQFSRRKTRKSNIVISLPLIASVKSILLEYGRIDNNKPNEYILPFLSQCTTEDAIRNRVHDIVRRVNKGLKSISQNICIRHITTCNARHTYAVLAQDSNMTTEQIQKFLGHASSRTTQVYLGSLTQRVKDKNRSMLEGLTQR